MKALLWLLAYVLCLIFVPIGLPVLIIVHFLSAAEKRRSRKREQEIEVAVARALARNEKRLR